MTEQTTEAPAPVISMDVLAKCYLNLRNKIQEITKQAETQVEILKAQQEEICTEMRRRLQEQGATSLKTPHGTVMLRVDRKYYPSDWDAFSNFIKQNQCTELLEKRVAQGNLLAWIDAHPDNVPPGLSSASQYVVTVRKPTTTA
jgi:hypothetical protein